MAELWEVSKDGLTWEAVEIPKDTAGVRLQGPRVRHDGQIDRVLSILSQQKWSQVSVPPGRQGLDIGALSPERARRPTIILPT